MHVERRFEKLTDDPNLASWCIIDGDKVYPFGPQESAESCLSRITAGKDRIEGYGAWPKGVYPVTELEWCVYQVKNTHPRAWSFQNWEGSAYVVSKGDGSLTWLAREATELEAWRKAEEIVAIERGRRQSAKIEIKETVPAPPYHGMWVAITDFNPEPSAEPEVSQVSYVDIYSATGSGDLLRGYIRGEEDGERLRISSICRDCGFCQLSFGGMVTCASCGSLSITHAPNNGSHAAQQTVRAGFEQGSI